MNSSFTNQIDFLRVSLLSPHLSQQRPGFRLVAPRTIPIFCTSHSIDRTFSPISSARPHRWDPKITKARRGSSDILLQNAEGVQEDNVPISVDGYVYRSTLRLVECAMFAAVSGLIYYLSNSLAIENYFGCFFSLPIVMSSMRWGISAGRKTMVATAMLLLTISGPLRACTYLLMHGFVGLAMGSFWSLGANWILSITFCTLVRALGAIGYVLISSFLLRENILSLIAVNLHASLSYMLACSSWCQHDPIDEGYLYHLWVPAAAQLWVFCFLVAHTVCNFLQQTWNEDLFVTTPMVRESSAIVVDMITFLILLILLVLYVYFYV